MQKPLMTEEQKIKFQVRINGQVLTEAQSKPLAEQFVMSLTREQQEKAEIVPVTGGGHQVLLG
jgi:hypothetical protein